MNVFKQKNNLTIDINFSYELINYKTFYEILDKVIEKKIKLRAINLANTGMTEQEAIRLYKLLPALEVEELNLSNNNIDPSLKVLAQILPQTNIKTLYLSHINSPLHKGIMELGASIKNSSLMTLDISYNNIGNLGSDFIKSLQLGNNNLKSLSLKGTDLSRIQLEALYSELIGSNITFLNLAENNAVGKTIVPWHKWIGNTVVNPTYNTLIEVITHTDITSLNIASTELKDFSLYALLQYIEKSKLCFLDLSKNPISDKGLTYIVNSLLTHKMCALKFTDTKVTDDGVKYSVPLLNNSHEMQEILLNSLSPKQQFLFREEVLYPKEIKDIGKDENYLVQDFPEYNDLEFFENFINNVNTTPYAIYMPDETHDTSYYYLPAIGIMVCTVLGVHYKTGFISGVISSAFLYFNNIYNNHNSCEQGVPLVAGIEATAEIV